jgi:hypothetical protein
MVEGVYLTGVELYDNALLAAKFNAPWSLGQWPGLLHLLKIGAYV